MDPKGVNGRAGKTWPGSLQSDFSLVWGRPGAQRCAGLHLGAVRERFGELSELRNRLSGSFRSSEIGSQSLLSVHFVGMFDFKAGRWQCGAHAMAENTKSHETCSTLSTNALDVRIFFQGPRMWPLARKSADPGEACGAVLKGVLGGKTLVAIHGIQYCRGTGRGG